MDVQIKRTVSHTILSRNLPVNEELHYQLFDAAGKRVYSKSIILINAENRIVETLELSHLAQGNYQLVISTGEKILQQAAVTL